MHLLQLKTTVGRLKWTREIPKALNPTPECQEKEKKTFPEKNTPTDCPIPNGQS